VLAAGGTPSGGDEGSATVFVMGGGAAAEFQVGRASPGLRLVHEASWCGLEPDRM
jgi:hypothetical protein